MVTLRLVTAPPLNQGPVSLLVCGASLVRESGLVRQGAQFGWWASLCLPVGPSSGTQEGERGGMGLGLRGGSVGAAPLLPVR